MVFCSKQKQKKTIPLIILMKEKNPNFILILMKWTPPSGIIAPLGSACAFTIFVDEQENYGAIFLTFSVIGHLQKPKNSYNIYTSPRQY